MSLFESGDGAGLVSLLDLFDGRGFAPTRSETTLQDIARWCCRGGWPANLNLEDGLACETAGQYVQYVLDVNVIDEGKSPEFAMALLRALAMNESQAVTYKTLSKDAFNGDANPDVNTIVSYLELFSRLKLTEDLGGWEPPMRSKARVRVKPKRYFCDPSLAAALLGATPDRLLRDTQTLSMLFENLVLRDLRVFMSTYSGIGNNVYYYRDDKDLEVDLIAEHQGRWGAIEVKLSDTKVDDGARNLKALERKVLANPAAKNAGPAFLAVVVGRGSLAYMRDDGVAVIPAATLTA